MQGSSANETKATNSGGTNMNCTDRDVLIDNADEGVARRDNQLVTAAQAAVPGAFAELHATYSPCLHKTIAMTLEDAEDALQETFLRVHSGPHTFEGRSGIYSWLTRIALNSALMILRRRASPETLSDPHPDSRADSPCFEVKDSSPVLEQICDFREPIVRVLHAIRNLDPQLQLPIRMQITLRASMKEIGRALNISEASVKTRLHRARRRLLTARDVKGLGPWRQSVDLSVQS